MPQILPAIRRHATLTGMTPEWSQVGTERDQGTKGKTGIPHGTLTDPAGWGLQQSQFRKLSPPTPDICFVGGHKTLPGPPGDGDLGPTGQASLSNRTPWIDRGAHAPLNTIPAALEAVGILALCGPAKSVAAPRRPDTTPQQPGPPGPPIWELDLARTTWAGPATS